MFYYVTEPIYKYPIPRVIHELEKKLQASKWLKCDTLTKGLLKGVYKQCYYSYIQNLYADFLYYSELED